MKKHFLSLKRQFIQSIVIGLAAALFPLNQVFAQALTGIKTIPGNYSSVALAVADLNANGVGTGGVIFNIAAGYTETLGSGLQVTATGTAANPIVFQKSGVGANPEIKAFTGIQLASNATFIDIMWAFVGSDYVTIDGIDLNEVPANTTATAQMEVGYGFYKASGTDGANNNTVKNCTITLNRNNTTASTGPRSNAAGSVGIEVMACTPAAVGTTIAVTAVSGASSNNKFYSNTIQNVNFGISMGGFAAPSPYTLADTGNDIGGSSVSTGNNIINFGGGSGATIQCGAVFIHNQWSFNISYNTINNNNGSGINHPTSNRGIWLYSSSIGAGCDVNNNKITISGGTSATIINWCIDAEMAQSGANGNTINIKNNQFLNCSFNTATSGAFTAIWLATAATTVNVTNNYIYGFTYTGTATSQVITSQTACGTLNILNNTIDSTVITGTTGSFYMIGVLALASDAFNVNGNNITKTIYNVATSGGKTLYGIFYNSASPIVNISDNTINDLTRNGTAGGTTIGIYHSSGTNGTSTITAKRNTISNITIAATATSAILYGIQLTAGTLICDSNTIFNLTATGSAATNAMYGIYVSGTSNNENYNYNTIYSFTHNGIGNTYGINTGTNTGVRTVSHNTISGFNGGGAVTGIYQTASTPSVFANKIYNLNTSNATLVVSGITISSTTAASGLAQVYNNLISGLGASVSSGGVTVRGIDLTSAAATTTIGVYNNTVYLNATSTGAAFSTAGIYHTYSATATTATLDMRNNIIVNTSTATGAGITAAFRRSASTNLLNFGASSNNNLFYAGTPSATNVIYHDGTTGDQTILDYKTRVAPRESASVSEVVTFLSTTGSSALFLAIDSTIATQIEATGLIIPGINKDYNDKVRAGFIGYTGNSGLPDLGALEGNYTGNITNQMVYDSSNADQFTGIAVRGTNNVKVLRVRVYTEKGYNALTAMAFSLTSSSTSSIADVSSAKIYYTASDSTFTNPQLFGSITPATIYTITGSAKLAGGANYFWVTYDVKPTATHGNFIDAGVSNITISSSSVSLINGDPIGNLQIKAPMSGIYNVGSSYSQPTITAALDELSQVGVSGPVTLVLMDPFYNTTTGEIFPLTVKTYSGSSAINTITIVPNFGVISRIESANATATIDLNGASNIIIDGRLGGSGGFVPGNNLVIANTSGTAPAIRFMNDALKNKILYTDLRATNATALTSANAGVVFFGTTTGTNGNDSNTIKYCDIHEETGGYPATGIASLGSANTITSHNEGNTIDSCNIYNYYHVTASNAAISIGANTGSWKINGNRFYQTAPRVFTGTATNRVLLIAPTASGTPTTMSGFEITNNFIGGNDRFGLGTYTISGASAHLMTIMEISVGNGVPTSIQNNTITSFNDSTSSASSIALVGMNIVWGNVNVGTIKGNLIGSRTITGAITFTATSATIGGVMGMRLGGGSGNAFNVANNIVSGIDMYGSTPTTSPEFFGMNVFQGVTINVTNNMIGDTSLANSIRVVTSSPTGVSNQRVTGLFCNAGAGFFTHTISGNTIANIVNNFAGTGAINACTRGIYIAPGAFAGTIIVNNNLIKEIQTGSNATATGVNATLSGITVTTTTSSISVSGNKIYALKLTDPTSTTAVRAYGIYFNGITTVSNSVSGNLVYGISVNAVNANAAITGIELAAGNVSVANNMVSLGFDDLGSSITAACSINGILKGTGSDNIYFNTVKIGGTGVAADPNRTFAFQRTGAGTDDVRNNIFMNSRNSSATGGGHLAVGLNNATTLTQNYNIYKADSFGVFNGIGQLTFANWKTATATLDVNSKDTTINFAGVNNLHLASNMNGVRTLEGVVISGVSIDFDGSLRSTIPYIGADEVTTHPLPVEFIGVAAVVKGNDVLVSWTTASEQNNRGFEVERSVDGRTFEYVNFVKGAGNSNKVVNYRLTDAEVFNKMNAQNIYYRIKQVDMDGRYSYSNIVKVSKTNSQLNGVSVYPNPFVSIPSVSVSTPSNGNAMIEISDLQGRLIGEENISVQTGLNMIPVTKLSGVNSGIYFVKITINGESQVVKVVKQ